MKISVITINYNDKSGLKNTILSVITQKKITFEYLVIDGGSTDGSKEIIDTYSNSIDYFISENDTGIYNAMNKGIKKANGDYCLFLNSGDTFYDEFVLSRMIYYCGKADILTGNLCLYSGSDYIKKWNAPISTDIFTFIYGTIPHESSLIRTKILKNNLYDESYKIISDWKFFLEQICIHDVTYLRIPLKCVKFDVNGVSSSNINLRNSERVAVINELFPMSVLCEFEKYKYIHGTIIEKYCKWRLKMHNNSSIIKRYFKKIKNIVLWQK